jgi:outer membrane protein assembly factor BamB
LWGTKVGFGFSNIVIKGIYLYTMGNDYKEDTVYCLDVVTGEEVWRHPYPCKSGGGGFGTQSNYNKSLIIKGVNKWILVMN